MKKINTLIIKGRVMLKSHFILFLFFVSSITYSQSLLDVNGGFEGGVIIDNDSAYASAEVGKWTKYHSDLTIALENTIKRSGDHSLLISNSSTTGRMVFTPRIEVAFTERVVIQYYRYVEDITNSQENKHGIFRNSDKSETGSYDNPSSSQIWEKQTYKPTSVTNTDNNLYAFIRSRQKGTGGNLFIDDFCIYVASSVDEIAPDPPTNLTVDQTTNNGELNISWSSPSTGIDDGGYILVRKQGTMPSTSPNINGIYAAGEEIASGETIVYQGTGTHFLDTGLDPSQNYYYSVYTYDKAYNYSSSLSQSNKPLPVELSIFNATVINKTVL